MNKNIRGGNWLKATEDRVNDNLREATPSQRFVAKDEFDEYISGMSNATQSAMADICHRNLTNRKIAARETLDKLRNGLPLYQVILLKDRDLLNLFKCHCGVATDITTIVNLFEDKKRAWQQIFKMMHRASRELKIISPMFRYNAYTITDKWVSIFFPRFIKNDFGTNSDPIFCALKDGTLNERIDVNWDILDKDELARKREKFPSTALEPQLDFEPIDQQPTIPQPVENSTPLNKHAIDYEAACDSIMMRMSLPEAYRKFTEEHIRQHYSGACGLNDTGIKQHLWYLRRGRNYSFSFFRLISEHVLELCKRGEITEKNLQRWTIPNVLASYKLAMGKKQAERLQAKKRFEEFSQKGYDALPTLYEDEVVKLFVLDKATPPEILLYVLSHHTQQLEHCIGSDGYHKGVYKPMISLDKPMLVADILKKQGGIGASYFRRILNGEIKVFAFHSATTNEPLLTGDVFMRERQEPYGANDSEVRIVNHHLNQLVGRRNAVPSEIYRSHIVNALNALQSKHNVSLDSDSMSLRGLRLSYDFGSKRWRAR